MTLSTKTLALLASSLMLTTAAPAIASAGPTNVQLPKRPPAGTAKVIPKRTKKQRLNLARTHVRKTATDQDLGAPIVLSPLVRQIGEHSELELYGVGLPIGDEEYAFVNPPSDPTTYPILINLRAEQGKQYLVDCRLSGGTDYEALAFQYDPGDTDLYSIEQLLSSTIKVQDSSVSFSIRPKGGKDVLVYLRNKNPQTGFSLSRCEITPVAT